MQIGMIGLGRMGANMTRRLLRAGHQVVGFDLSQELAAEMAAEGVQIASSLPELAAELKPRRVIWMMIPAGAPVEQTIDKLRSQLSPGDILVDGGNSHYGDSQRRATELHNSGILFLDLGTSGGIWGLSEGYCLMAGGPSEGFQHIEPILAALATEGGYAHVGPSGAGHFAKMIHNGIEYGILQAYAEGFEMLQAKTEMRFDLQQLATLWNQGSVIRSWLLELLEQVFQREPNLASIKGWVADSGEGRWAVKEAIDLNIPAPITTLSLLQRFASRQEESFAAKVIAALRAEFGGHAVKEAV